MMKTIKLVFGIVALCTQFSAYTQQHVDVRISESHINKALDIITAAKGINYGDYKDQFGLNAWFVNLDDASIVIGDNNSLTIDNIEITGGVDLQLFLFSITPIETFTGSIEGYFEVMGDNEEGYTLAIKPTNFIINDITGAPQAIEDVLQFVVNNTDLIPDLNVNLGTSLFPDQLDERFVSGIPEILTKTRIPILPPFVYIPGHVTFRFKVLFDHLLVSDVTINSNKEEEYVARESITLKPDFWAKAGSDVHIYILDETQGRPIYEEPGKPNEGLIGELLWLGDDTLYEEQVQLFPNPTKGEINISGIPKSVLSYKIVNASGKTITQGRTTSEGHHKVDLSGYPEGVYILILSDSEKVISKKMIKH